MVLLRDFSRGGGVRRLGRRRGRYVVGGSPTIVIKSYREWTGICVKRGVVGVKAVGSGLWIVGEYEGAHKLSFCKFGYFSS